MNYRDFLTKLLLFGTVLLSVNGFAQVPEKARQLFEKGEFNKARKIINPKSTGTLSKEAEIFLAKMNRIEIDFSKNEAQIIAELQPYFPNINAAQLEKWEANKKLEMRIINREKRYFRNAVPNLFRVDSVAYAAKIQKDGLQPDPLDAFRIKHTTNVIHAISENSSPEAVHQKFKIDFKITLKPGVVPEGETVRCWMPFPRISPPRQTNITLLSETNFSPENTQLQSSLYDEKVVKKDVPTEFGYVAEFETTAQWFNLQPDDILPYNTDAVLYKTYTAERPPQITFTKEIKTLAKNITKGIENPLEKVKAIYYWIDKNIPWASALEYSTMDSIPQYVLENRKGDCGMQTLLFMSLARYSGIPCKWQSGWMLHPNAVNLHDWCEVYYEGIGWVPLDQSFGLQNSDNKQVKEFYITGIDAYRLIVNDDYGCAFVPPKKFYRSEPLDFQRGELEWSDGNLYFNDWNYSMKVTYLNSK